MYPILLKIKNKPVTVIGGGKVAARKIQFLLAEGADVKVVSPSLDSSIDKEKIRWVKQFYDADTIADAALIFACTNNDSVNQQVLADANAAQWVNVTSDKIISEFYNMAVANVADLTVSVSTSGVSPSRAKQIREKITAYLKELEEQQCI